MLKIIAILIIAYIFTFSTNTKVYVAPVSQISTTTPSTATTTTKIAGAATSTTPQIAKKVATTTKTKPVAAKKVEIKPVQQAPVAPEPTPDFEAINVFARKAIVNILCTTKGGELSPISGTGVVVSPSGLILTNAHLGQYFLLKDWREKNFMSCVIRTGSPAYPKYNLELVYISPAWVANNKTLLKEQNPQGTGENDFAFFRITDAIDHTKLPDPFSFITMNIREVINIGETTLLASYPAGFLGGISVLNDLSITSAIAYVSELLTFKDGTIDIISVPRTVVSQKGSSGGAVVDKYGTLIGIITTSSSGNTTAERDLRAITLSYINRDLQKELGINLEQFVTQDIPTFAKKFQEINAPSLTKLITTELEKN